MKSIAAGLAPLMLAGCVATDPTGGVPGSYNPAPLTPQTITGKTFADGAAPFVEGDGTVLGTTSTSDVSLTVVNPTTLDVTIDGVTRRLIDNGSSFASSGGDVSFQLFYVNNSGQLSADQIQFLGVVTDSVSGLSYYGGFVDGNRTPASFMPTSGSALYTGRVDSVDGTGSTGFGSVTLRADFAAATLGGTMTGVIPARSGTVFTLAPASISGNRFDTTLTSTAVTVNNSAVSGRFFGAGAGGAGGSFSVETSAGNGIGVFSADQ